MSAWNHWYHATIHTYGTWLRGDPRGWRARHHREHVEGDYKRRPPKGTYDDVHEYSKSLMKRDPVEIDQREIVAFVLKALTARLQKYRTPLAIGSFDGIHAHLLVQCTNRSPRVLIGIAKQYATAQLKLQIKLHEQQRDRTHGTAVGFRQKDSTDWNALDLREGEGIWGKRSHPKPIADSEHYDHTFDYIHGHEKKGAVVIVATEAAARELTEEDFLRDFGLK